MDHYAVMGFPIAHSLSPQIHRLFAEQTQQQLEYTKIEVPPEQFADALTQFIQAGGKGLNITLPLKTIAYDYVHEYDDSAAFAAAVNTITISPEGILKGYNTDGIGLIRDLTDNHHIKLKNKNILLLGAGGAVQGVLHPFLTQQCNITLANRTLIKAQVLARNFSSFGKITVCSYEQLAGKQFDIIINGTSAGLQNIVPPIPDGCLARNGITYDMLYSKEPTAFVQWGIQKGASKALDGLGMLVEQAAEAFFIWRGKKPITTTIFNSLRC